MEKLIKQKFLNSVLFTALAFYLIRPAKRAEMEALWADGWSFGNGNGKTRAGAKAAVVISTAASADGRFLCCDHCRSSYGDAAEVEDKIFVSGYDSTADGRRYYLGCAQ